MRIYDKLYIDGQWVTPNGTDTNDVVSPSTLQVVATVPYGDATDVDVAVKAARAAFDSWSTTPSAVRAKYLRAIADEMQKRLVDFETTMVEELGMPIGLADDYQISGPIGACRDYAERAAFMDKTEEVDNVLIVKEAVGVCAFINPWNYPLHQMIGKMAPALAAGCTMVVKASSQTPSHAFILAEIIHAVGLPAGVFNLVHGSGRVMGESMCSHPDVDMVSFTGSTSAGIKIAEAAAPTVKRVCQELGGKSPYIITEDADLEKAVIFGVEDVMVNTGQTCTALTRMLVPQSRYEEAVQIAKTHAESLVVGDPTDPKSYMGPMSSQGQRETVLDYINKGVAEGARLVTGGTDLPEGIENGAYVRPTIFSDVNNQMVIAQQEIFGPVVTITRFESEEEAIKLANQTPFGLCAYAFTENAKRQWRLSEQLDFGMVGINDGVLSNTLAPFGGTKESGMGREGGGWGIEDYLETRYVCIGNLD